MWPTARPATRSLGVRDIIVGSSPDYSPEVAVIDGHTLFTAPTAQAARTLNVAPLFFRGVITVQAAPNDGGDPGTVESEVVFDELIPNQTHGNVATDEFNSITFFNQGGGGH